jgi:competence protein ComEA
MHRLIIRMAAVLALALSGLAHAGTVNINSADAATLAAELDGVGMARAEAIVAYRQKVGRFESAEQLLDVSGIGPRILEWNQERIVLGPEQAED